MKQRKENEISVYMVCMGIFTFVCALFILWVCAEAMFMPEAYIERVVK